NVCVYGIFADTVICATELDAGSGSENCARRVRQSLWTKLGSQRVDDIRVGPARGYSHDGHQIDVAGAVEGFDGAVGVKLNLEVNRRPARAATSLIVARHTLPAKN